MERSEISENSSTENVLSNGFSQDLQKMTILCFLPGLAEPPEWLFLGLEEPELNMLRLLDLTVFKVIRVDPVRE